MSLNEMHKINNQNELRDFLDSFESNLKILNEKMNHLHFKQLVEKTSVPEISQLQKEYTGLVSNPVLEELINTWSKKATDPILKRRLTLFKNQIESGKIRLHPDVLSLTKELDEEIISYQYMVGDEKSDLGTIKDILRTSPDPALRKKAWLGKVAISDSLALD